MGSDSLAESSGGSNESIHGLKFGKKIYFEDAAASGASNKATGPGSSSSGSGRKVRGGSSSGGSSGSGGVAQTGQPPRCQVEGCQVDLSDAKTYYSRHKVCGMHSKSPMVIVAGLQQRFCQQCSRFHQLPEFDQGKRSCRRRLAGHNERRRKPPPGSLLATRFGRPASSLSDNSSRGGGFLVDFSAYSRGGRDAWPLSRSTEQVPTNQTTAAARHHVAHHPPWHNQPENPPASEIFLQGSGSGTHFPSGECFTGVADSSCALSLLSNQSWGSSSSRNQPSALGVAHTQGVSMTQSHPTAAAVDQYPNVPWGSFSGEMPPHLGLGSVSNPVVDGQFGGGLDLSQHSRGAHNHMELDQARDDYGASAEQMHWSL